MIAKILELKKLKRLRLTRIHSLRSSHAVDICKHCPELSELQIHEMNMLLSADNVLEMIRYANNLKKLICAGPKYLDMTVNVDEMSNDVGRYKKMKMNANTSLEYLSLCNIHPRVNAHQLVAGILKFKNLTYLCLSINGLNVLHIIDICRNCTELSELIFTINKHVLSINQLLEIIQHAEKLKKLQHKYPHDTLFHKQNFNKICIDAGTYIKMANIVQNRRHKTVIVLSSWSYKTQIPDELIQMSKNYFELNVKLA